MLRVLKLLIMLERLIAAEFELSELDLPRRDWRLHLWERHHWLQVIVVLDNAALLQRALCWC